MNLRKHSSLLLLLVPLLLLACSGDDVPTADEVTTTLPLVAPANLLSRIQSSDAREGPAPDTSKPVPHQQLNQNAPSSMQDRLIARIDALPGIVIAATTSSLPGSVGWFLADQYRTGPDDAYISPSIPGEIGHSHEPGDGSMHFRLPSAYATIVLAKGWGERHPLSADIASENQDYVMVYGPRDEDELQIIWLLVQVPYYYASGQLPSS